MIRYHQNQSSQLDILTHLQNCDHLFPNSLSSRVNLSDYATKLHEKAIRFEAWDENKLVGLIAAYHNSEKHFFYITSVSVEENYSKQGIAQNLLEQTIHAAEELHATSIELEVHEVNTKAIGLYVKNGFSESDEKKDSDMKKLMYFVNRR